MDPIFGLAQMLQTYGAWGLVAILFVALYLMWRANTDERAAEAKRYADVRDKHDAMNTDQVKAAIELVEECTRSSVEQKNTSQQLNITMQSIERRLENVEKKLEQRFADLSDR